MGGKLRKYKSEGKFLVGENFFERLADSSEESKLDGPWRSSWYFFFSFLFFCGKIGYLFSSSALLPLSCEVSLGAKSGIAKRGGGEGCLSPSVCLPPKASKKEALFQMGMVKRPPFFFFRVVGGNGSACSTESDAGSEGSLSLLLLLFYLLLLLSP